MNRKDEINTGLEAIRAGWSFIESELTARLNMYITSLISQESQDVRGRIKAIQDVLDMPSQLRSELEGIERGTS